MCAFQLFHRNQGKEAGWLSCQELSSRKNTRARLFPYVGLPRDSVLTKSTMDILNKAYQAPPMRCWLCQVWGWRNAQLTWPLCLWSLLSNAERQTLIQLTCIRCPLYVRQYERKGLEDTVFAQIGNMSPFPSIWEETESKTDDGQWHMNINFSSIWEGTLEYSSQHLPSGRARRASCELSFSKTFEDVKLWITLRKKRHISLRKHVEFCS